MEQKDEAMVYASFALVALLIRAGYSLKETNVKEAWELAKLMIEHKPEEFK